MLVVLDTECTITLSLKYPFFKISMMVDSINVVNIGSKVLIRVNVLSKKDGIIGISSCDSPESNFGFAPDLILFCSKILIMVSTLNHIITRHHTINVGNRVSRLDIVYLDINKLECFIRSAACLGVNIEVNAIFIHSNPSVSKVSISNAKVTITSLFNVPSLIVPIMDNSINIVTTTSKILI